MGFDRHLEQTGFESEDQAFNGAKNGWVKMGGGFFLYRTNRIYPVNGRMIPDKLFFTNRAKM
jgi:hypothetical protein